jgi:carbon storage regulator
MLVISRKPGEKLRIGDNVEIAVLEISGSRVVLGIEAPREIAVRRVGSAVESAEDDCVALAPATSAVGSIGEQLSATAVPLPFQYPSRSTPDAAERPVKVPVVTVRRSRKIALPVDGETG